MEECEKAFRELFPDLLTPVVILCDTVYHHCIGILFCSILFSIIYGYFSPAELTERLSDYPHCNPSHLSLPHPITPSPSTETTPTQHHTPSGDEVSVASDPNNAHSLSVSGSLSVERLKLEAANNAFLLIS